MNQEKQRAIKILKKINKRALYTLKQNPQLLHKIKITKYGSCNIDGSILLYVYYETSYSKNCDYFPISKRLNFHEVLYYLRESLKHWNQRRDKNG